MEKLWAPWRLEYIKSEKPKDYCPFCDIPKEEPSEKNFVFFRDDDIFVVMNIFPYNPGHLMVIPRKHIADPSELDTKVWYKMSRAIQLCLKVLKKHSDPQGFNLGMNLGAVGGAGIPGHIHWHILPRWNGDTNFMPLLAETKAIPTHNTTVYRQLKDYFSDFAEKLTTDKLE